MRTVKTVSEHVAKELANLMHAYGVRDKDMFFIIASLSLTGIAQGCVLEGANESDVLRSLDEGLNGVAARAEKEFG